MHELVQGFLHLTFIRIVKCENVTVFYSMSQHIYLYIMLKIYFPLFFFGLAVLLQSSNGHAKNFLCLNAKFSFARFIPIKILQFIKIFSLKAFVLYRNTLSGPFAYRSNNASFLLSSFDHLFLFLWGRGMGRNKSSFKGGSWWFSVAKVYAKYIFSVKIFSWQSFWLYSSKAVNYVKPWMIVKCLFIYVSSMYEFSFGNYCSYEGNSEIVWVIRCYILAFFYANYYVVDKVDFSQSSK